MSESETYKCNGRTFHSYEAVEGYCRIMGYRITGTTTKGGIHFVDVVINHEHEPELH